MFDNGVVLPAFGWQATENISWGLKNILVAKYGKATPFIPRMHSIREDLMIVEQSNEVVVTMLLVSKTLRLLLEPA